MRRPIPVVGRIVLFPHLHWDHRFAGSGITAKMTVGEDELDDQKQAQLEGFFGKPAAE